MQVDWFIVAAQIANFVILVFLLKRFLYAPILGAMDEREQRVADQVRGAEEQRVAAEAEARALRERSADIEQTRGRLLEEARAEAETGRRKQLEEARREVDDIRRRWRKDIENERTGFLGALRTEATGALVDALRRSLEGLADASLEDRIVHVFVRRLRETSAEDRGAFGAGAAGDIRVLTAFELSSEHRSAIESTLRDDFGIEVAITFDRSADLVCGISLQSDSTELAWSFENHVAELGERVAALFREQHDPGQTSTAPGSPP